MPAEPAIAPAIPRAEYERDVLIRHLRVGCYLVMVLMPFGVILDAFYYHEEVWRFLIFRLACSLLLVPVPSLLQTAFGRRHYQTLGLIVALLPAFFICWMIYETEGAQSPYYAGLNLILLAIAFVLRWSVGLSLLSLSIITLMYGAACAFHGIPHQGEMRHRAISELVNNLYFLGLTGIIVVTGSQVHHRLRVREKALSQQLARSKEEIQQTNEELQETIEKLRTTQHQLVEAEKRKSLGVLAGGIIHDIGNTLNHARTNLFALRKKVTAIAPEQAAAFERISGDLESGIKQAMSTVQRVRIYTHPNTDLREPAAVEELVDAALLFTASVWRENQVRVETRLAPGQAVVGNKQSLIDVIVNLPLNSVDALRQKQFANGEAATIWVEGELKDGRSLLRVRDNGVGIDPAIQARVFDPYYTTKDVGEGTGLGLSTCKSTVENYGGHITLRSVPGEFAEFTLDFPDKGSD